MSFFCVVCLGLTSLLEFIALTFFLLLLWAFVHRCFGQCFACQTSFPLPSVYCLGKLYKIPYSYAVALIFFSVFSFFLHINSVLQFLLLGLTVFALVLVRPISCVSFCFCCASFVFVMLIGITSVFDLLVGLFFRLLAFFWLVCWCLFLVCCFLAVVRLDKYRRPDPCDHYHAFFTCSPIVYINYAHPHHSWASMHIRSCLCVCC